MRRRLLLGHGVRRSRLRQLRAGQSGGPQRAVSRRAAPHRIASHCTPCGRAGRGVERRPPRRRSSPTSTPLSAPTAGGVYVPLAFLTVYRFYGRAATSRAFLTVLGAGRAGRRPARCAATASTARTPRGRRSVPTASPATRRSATAVRSLAPAALLAQPPPNAYVLMCLCGIMLTR